LNERQYDILEAMLILKATDPARKKTTEEIAIAAEGSESNPEAFKHPIANLKRRGLVATRGGRGGGCWLTPSGRSLAEQLKKR
jgi:DNA-binding IscR family transcriptional regulator